MVTRRKTTDTDDIMAALQSDGITVESIEETEPLNLGPEENPEPDPDLPPGPRRRAGKIQRELEQLYATMGSTIYVFNPKIGATIVENSTRCAESLDELARTNPAVRKALMAMLETGAWSGVIIAHMPIAMAVATEYIPSFREAFAPQGYEPPSENQTNGFVYQ